MPVLKYTAAPVASSKCRSASQRPAFSSWLRSGAVSLALVLVVPAGLLGCCKGSKGDSSATGGGSAAAPAHGAPTAAAPSVNVTAPPKGIFPPGAADQILPKGGAPIVRIIDAGAEPRTPLRYAITPGTVTTDTTLDVSSKAAAMSVTLPRISMTYEYVIAAPQSAQWPVTATLRSTKVDGGAGASAAIASMLRTQLKKLEGLTFTYQLDDRGRVSNMKSSLADRRSPELDEILRTITASQQAMSLGLPDEPIGKGGKWQVITRSPDTGMDVLQEVVCTLTDRRGTAVTIDMAIRQFAASDQLTSGPGKGRLRSFASNATMHTEGELSAIVPRTGTMQQEYKFDTGQGDVGAVNKVGFTRR